MSWEFYMSSKIWLANLKDCLNLILGLLCTSVLLSKHVSILRNEKVLSPKCVKSEFWHSCPSCFILQGIYISDHISFAICHDNCIFTIFVIILICYLPYLIIVQQSLTCGSIYRNHCFRSWHIFIPGYWYIEFGLLFSIAVCGKIKVMHVANVSSLHVVPSQLVGTHPLAWDRLYM